MTLAIHSPGFQHEAGIPRRFTCQGENLSPPVTWSGVPDGTQSLVLIVDDPDAPDPRAPRMTWVHWVVYNIPADARGLAEGVKDGELPHGTRIGTNGWGRRDYGGPCPPIGRHRYFHKLYALDTVLKNVGDAGKDDIEAGMKGHILAQAALIGTYQKGDR